jgi:hypothetical protein
MSHSNVAIDTVAIDAVTLHDGEVPHFDRFRIARTLRLQRWGSVNEDLLIARAVQFRIGSPQPRRGVRFRSRMAAQPAHDPPVVFLKERSALFPLKEGSAPFPSPAIAPSTTTCGLRLDGGCR